MEAAVLWQIRLPRAVLAIAVGAGLGLAGAAQQGLFRNPLADPALIGVSAGAALAAVAGIVLGTPVWLPVPACAFAGGLVATLLALRLAGTGEGTGRLLLAGIAVNAICSAGTGLLITMSDDRQLRDITFWTMGSLAGGGWGGALAALAATAPISNGARQAGGEKNGGAAPAGALLIQAWPDRVAKARGERGRFVLANGSGAMLEAADPLGKAQNARITAAAAI
eukprot:gene8666-11741_t